LSCKGWGKKEREGKKKGEMPLFKAEAEREPER
jgi:hypothetical protein